MFHDSVAGLYSWVLLYKSSISASKFTSGGMSNAGQSDTGELILYTPIYGSQNSCISSFV